MGLPYQFSGNPPNPLSYKRLQFHHLNAISTLCLETFGSKPSNYALTYRPHSQEQWKTQFERALTNKLQAQRESRMYRLTKHSQALLAHIQSLQASEGRQPSSFVPPFTETPQEKTLRGRRHLRRSFFCVIAEEETPNGCQSTDATPRVSAHPAEHDSTTNNRIDDEMVEFSTTTTTTSYLSSQQDVDSNTTSISSGSCTIHEKRQDVLTTVPSVACTLAGCATLTLARPEAALPPPFPTRAALRPYISNVAVAPSYRRQGIATKLITKLERYVRILMH